MSIEPIVRYSSKTEGKITLAAVFVFIFVFALAFLIDTQYRGVSASDTATTSVTVLNSPPEWIDGPFEDPASSTTTPTNEGDVVTWKGTAEDPNGTNNFFLLICKNDANGNEDNLTLYDPDTGALPECSGGLSEQWAISTSTTDLAEATATYTVPEGRTEAEVNEWYAFICDDDDINPRCNVTDIQQENIAGGEVDGDGSPFYVNYRPEFTEFTAPDPTDPGSIATWTSTSTDPNTQLAVSEVRLFVCRTDQFDEANLECDGGMANTYASSTLTASNPSVNYEVEIPKPNDTYDAYGFVVDAFGLAAPLPSDTTYDGQEPRMQGTNEALVVNNVAPELETASVTLLNHTGVAEDLSVEVAEGETENFGVEFTTADDNSCVAADWESGLDTADHPEITAVEVNIYRDGVGMANCVNDGDYDPNNCYPYNVEDSTYEATGGWNITCTRDDSTCSGDDDRTVDWDCSYPLWYSADPTDGADTTEVEFPNDNWVASVTAIDTDGATSTLAEGDTGVDLLRFLSFTLNQNSIAFGELEPGDRNDPLDRPAPIIATGNTGVNQELEGTPMCPGFDVNDPDFGCTNYDDGAGNIDQVPEDTIPAEYQRFGVGTSTDYVSGTQLADQLLGESAAFLELNVLKTTQVLNPEERDSGWGIEIPTEITIAGEYQGENLFTGLVSDATNWSN